MRELIESLDRGQKISVGVLPHTVRADMAERGIRARTIWLYVSETYTLFSPGDDGERGFCDVIDPLGNVSAKTGAFGGGALGVAQQSPVDTDQSKRPLADGWFVLKGSEGGRGAHGSLYANPATAAKLLGAR